MGTPGAATPGKRLKLSRDDGDDDGELVAIKKFKPDKEGEAVTYTGISQSACREIMVRRSGRDCAEVAGADCRFECPRSTARFRTNTSLR